MGTHTIRKVAEPMLEPVTLSEMKQHLGISVDMAEDDAVLAGMISAARRIVEARSGTTLMETQYRVSASSRPRSRCGCVSRCGAPDGIALQRGPVLVDADHPIAVEYTDDMGLPVPLDPAAYEYDADGGVVRAASGEFPESTHVVYWAGYSRRDDIPATLRHTVKILATTLYANRGDGSAEGDVGAGYEAADILLSAEWDGRMYQ